MMPRGVKMKLFLVLLLAPSVSTASTPSCRNLQVEHSERHGEVEGCYEWIGSCTGRSYYKFSSNSSRHHMKTVYIFFNNASQNNNFTGWVISTTPCAYVNVLVRSPDTADSPERVTVPWEERVGSLPVYSTSEDFEVTCADKRTTLDIVLLSVALVASLLVVVVATVGVVFWRLKSHSVSQPPEVVGGEQTTDDTVAVEAETRDSAEEPPIYSIVTELPEVELLPPYTEVDPHPLPVFDPRSSSIQLEPLTIVWQSYV